MSDKIMKSLNGYTVHDAGAREAIEALKGSAPGLVFDTVADMEAYVAEHSAELKIGQDLYIRETDAPDYWWDGTQAVPVETDMTAIRKEVSELSEAVADKLSANQGAANVGKILVVGADGNLTLTDMPEGGASGDVIGMIDGNNNIIITGDLADGTYVFKYEGASGTYTDIGSLVVGGVVQYSITVNLTECTAASGNTAVINENGTATLRFVAKDGFLLTDTITVSGASYTWDSATGTLVLSNPTSDITVSIVATKDGYTNIIDTVGYTDGYRLSTSSGSLSEAAGYTSTGSITVPSGSHVIRTKGVNFNKGTSCAIVLYTGGGVYSTGNKLYGQGTTAWNGFTWSFDADGNVTMNYSSTAPAYAKICGYGSGADLIVTIDEEIKD